MKLKNINIEERMKHYNVQGLSITLLEGREISGEDINIENTTKWLKDFFNSSDSSIITIDLIQQVVAAAFNITVDELIKDEKEQFDISKINVLDVLREQKEMKLKGNLYHNTQIIFAYNTNHREGNKLTENQTR